MPYTTINKYEKEEHPWPAFIPHNADKLILGTFPTAKNNRKACDFFYPNPNNSFWDIIFQIAGKNLNYFSSFDQVQIRKEILTDLKMGIADMGRVILRQN